MRIEQIRKELLPGRGRVTADIIWEDRDAPAESLVIETTEPFATELEPSRDAFLLAMFPLAQWHGESRIRIEGTICCRLRDGLSAAAELLALWYEHCGPIRIEPTEGFAPTLPRSEPRAASFLSGGIDALSLLRRNRLEYPEWHPGAICDSILFFGLGSGEFGETDDQPQRLAEFESYAQRITFLAERTGVTLIPIYTNIRSFYPPPSGWAAAGFGGGMLSAAFCLSGRIDRIEVASAGLGLRQQPRGSNPSLDHHFSTAAVAVHHAQPGLTRLEKTRIVADWPEGMAVLRPCVLDTIPLENRTNCGECEKCVRTMLALVALGKLDQAPTFPFDDVTPGMLELIWIDDPNILPYYMECIELLIARGRSDLVKPILRKVDEWRRWQRRQKLRHFIRRASGLDLLLKPH